MPSDKLPAQSSLPPRFAIPIPKHEVWELYGELGIASWTAGRLTRAAAAFSVLVNGILTEWDPKNRRFREVYRKTAHVLGWYAPVAAGGAPPQAVAGGGEYVRPSPGLFNMKRPLLADLNTPMPKALLPFFLGRILNGLFLERAALKRLALARDICREEMTWLLLAEIQVVLPPIESFRGQVDGATADAIEGVKLIASFSTLEERGEDPFVSQADPDRIWKELLPAKKTDAQTLLFWLTVAPWLTSLLSSPGDPSVIRSWIEAVDRYSALLVDPNYWKRVFEAAAYMIEPFRREEAIRAINSLPSTDIALRYTLYFCALKAIGCRPSDALTIHAELLSQMVARRLTAPGMLCRFCSHVAEYWHTVARAKGFQLYSPGEFRNRMAGIGEKQDLASACQILLWAEQATMTVIPHGIRTILAAQI